MRTLAANIAVEIPEAPQGGTLYRVLFLAALLLFVVTFLVNTLAEVAAPAAPQEVHGDLMSATLSRRDPGAARAARRSPSSSSGRASR